MSQRGESNRQTRADRILTSWSSFKRKIVCVARSVGKDLRSTFGPIWFPVMAGLLVRYGVAVYSSATTLQVFAQISLGIAYGNGPYASLNIYPPGWAFLLGSIGHVVALGLPPGQFAQSNPLAASLVVNRGLIEPTALVSPIYALAEKSVLFLFDLGNGILLYLIAKNYFKPKISAKSVFYLWFLNPLVITVSALDGDYDTLPVFFVLLTILLVLEGQYLFSGLSLGISIGLKLFPIFLFPLVLGIAWRVTKQSSSEFRRAFGWLVVGCGVTLLVGLWPPGVFTQYVTDALTGTNVGLSFGGFWIWSVTSLPGFGNLGSFLTTNSKQVFYSTTAIAIVICLFFAIRLAQHAPRAISIREVSAAGFLCIIGVYFDTSIVQPQ